MSKSKAVKNSRINAVPTDIRQVEGGKKINIKNHVKILFTVLVTLLIVFILLFFAAKNILPDLLGDTVVNNENVKSVSEETLLDKKAPYFDLSDIFGNRVKLDNFQYKPTIIFFWTTWSKESTDQIKIFDDYLAHNIQNPLIKVLAINNLEEVSIIKSFIKRGGYNIQVALDTIGVVSKEYNIKSLPTTYFIDKDGMVREIYTGVLSEGDIVDKVENLLK